MDHLVDKVREIEAGIQGAGIRISLDGDFLTIRAPGDKVTRLAIKRLYRPSSKEVEGNESLDSVLVLESPTAKAIKTASQYNHIALSGDSFRIIARGIAISQTGNVGAYQSPKKVKLTGLSGVVAETLLIGKDDWWTVRRLAQSAEVSPALAHRVLSRLEAEKLVTVAGRGPERERCVVKAQALAELWSEEERAPVSLVKGYLYASSQEGVAGSAIEACGAGAIGGAMAANLYSPVLTRAPLPIRIWIPEALSATAISKSGFKQTDEGINIEFARAKGDPWAVKIYTAKGTPRVSAWRAWAEIGSSTGRTKELADELLSKLLDEN